METKLYVSKLERYKVICFFDDNELLLDIVKILGGATTLDSFLKACKASETKGFFPYERYHNPDKLDFPELPAYEAFFIKLRNNNPLDKDFIDYKKLRKNGLDEQQVLKKLQIKTVPPSGLDKTRKKRGRKTE